MVRRWLCGVAVILVMAAASRSNAQSGGELHGSVKDVTGSVIPAAVVELTDANGRRYRTSTDTVGEYRFSGLPAGSYALLVTAPGFAAFSAATELIPAGAGTLDVTLQVTVTETVDVTSELGLSTEDALFSLVLSGKGLDSLPDGVDLVQRLREMTAASGRPGDSMVYVNGFPQAVRLPPKEMIEKIRITWNPFAPEFADPGRVRVDIITKPGAGKWHGDAGGTSNPSQLSANNAFAKSPIPDSTRSYNAYLSGPLVKNRLSVSAWVGQWALDVNRVVNARILNPSTLEPEPFVTTVGAPTRVDSVWFGINSQPGRRHTMDVSFSETRERDTNQGLDSGFDLPERSYYRSIRDDVVQVSLTSQFGSRALNAIRLGLSRRTEGTSALRTGPAIEVLDAFNGGANQAFLDTDSQNDALQFTNQFTVFGKSASFKVGVDVDAIRRKDLDRSNFTGTYVFGSDVERDRLGQPVIGDSGASIPVTPLENYQRTLLGRAGYSPSQFSIVRGDPRIDYTQSWIGWFAQHDWTIGRRLSLLYGVRQEFQTLVPSRTDFAPRAGLALAIDSGRKNVVRLSSGLFFQHLGNDLMRDLIRFDGVHRQLVVINRPSFFPEGTDPDATPVPSAVHVLTENVRAPESFSSTLGYERRLPGAIVGISVTQERGWHLLRMRNVNAPLGGPSAPRPYPDRGPTLQYEATGSSLRRELLVTLQTSGAKAVSITGHYALSSLRTDTDGPSTVPADSYDLSTELGPAQTDRQHQGSIGVSFRLPLIGVVVTPFLTAASAQPFNITTGRDDNGDTLFTDRPAFGQPGAPGVVTTPYGVFNPTPGPGDRIIPRNFGREAMQVRLDLRVARTFSVAGAVKLDLSADGENILNRANLAGFNGVLTSPVFGQPNRAVSPRRVALTTRLSF